MTVRGWTCQRLLSTLLSSTNTIPKRSLFAWLTSVWNSVDEDRIREIGPDRACAEWLLKNGASVRWKGVDEFLADYDALLSTTGNQPHFIQAVDATDSSIHHMGFAYFGRSQWVSKKLLFFSHGRELTIFNEKQTFPLAGCKYIDQIKLNRCLYIENEALRRLNVVKDTLKHLEVLDCGNITDEALKSLKNLTNLKVLKLRGMPYVKDKSGVEKELTIALPNCTIEWK